jgi:glycosyltransferase involved in cell wall biosynthesis
MEAGKANDSVKPESLKLADFKLSGFMPALKIGFDGKRVVRNFTGLGNYSRYVIEILTTYFPKNEYIAYSSRKINNIQGEVLKGLFAVSFHYPKSSLLKSLWRSFGIIGDLKNDGIDIYHGLSNEIPFGIKKTGIPSIVTIHDLIFLRYPHYYPWFDRMIYRLKFGYACRNADRIIAISEQTKRDIIEHFNIPENRIDVIYQNCHPLFQKNVATDELTRIKKVYHLPDQYLLNVGTIESRKNLMVIVRALIEIRSDVHLVVIGRETAYAEKVKSFILENNLTDRVHFLKNVPLEDLPGIYRQAEIFVFPSEFEGFGIPIVEALHSKIPVIAASGSCLREAGGPESIYIRPDDVSGFTAAITSLLDNPDKKQRMIDAGTDYLKRFSNQNIASQLIELYQIVKRNA